jgi:hypothetical protein
MTESRNEQSGEFECEGGTECPECHQMSLHFGYGLLGGGIGSYETCDRCEYFKKQQDPEMGRRE